MNRLKIALAIGLWGAITMIALTGIDTVQPILAAGLGATLAGACVAPLFASAKAGSSLTAALLATTLGAALASALVLEANDFPASLILGPWFVWSGLMASPLALLIWLGGLVAIHYAAQT